MNKSLTALISGSVCVLLTLVSCASTPKDDSLKQYFAENTVEDNTAPYEDVTTVQGNYIIRGNPDPTKLAKNDVMSVTEIVENPVYYDFSNSSKIKITIDVIEELLLHEDLTNEQKVKLMNYLFDDLPKNGTDGMIREVRLGKFYTAGSGDAKNLVIRIGSFTPDESAAVKNEKILIIFSNAIKNDEGNIPRIMGSFISFDVNATVIAAYNTPVLRNLTASTADELNQQDTEGLDNFGKYNLAQMLLKDESPENDVKALTLADEILSGNPDPAIKLFAMITKFDYYVLNEDLENAQAQWDAVIEYCPNVPGEATPEKLNAINGEGLYLLKALKAAEVK